MKKINLFFLVLIAISCATDTGRFDVNGLEKIKSSASDNMVYLGNYSPSKTNRGPASVAKASQKDPELSNRQIYFLSFYRQYLKLGQAVGAEARVQNCPSFHQVVLEYKDKLEAPYVSKIPVLDQSLFQSDITQISNYPVLALSVEKDAVLWQDLQEKNWKQDSDLVSKAISYHREEMTKELSQLCETGVSAGYYVYENLVTYFKEYKDFHYSRNGLKALLKVPTLANMVVLDNLTHDSYYINQDTEFDHWLLKRANTEWFKQYRDHLKFQRDQLLEAKYSK